MEPSAGNKRLHGADSAYDTKRARCYEPNGINPLQELPNPFWIRNEVHESIERRVKQITNEQWNKASIEFMEHAFNLLSMPDGPLHRNLHNCLPYLQEVFASENIRSLFSSLFSQPYPNRFLLVRSLKDHYIEIVTRYKDAKQDGPEPMQIT